MNTEKKTTNAKASPIRIIKVATCKSFSGKAKLTYHIGCRGKTKIFFRIYANDGGGFFSDEWVGHTDIGTALDAMKMPNAVYPLRSTQLCNGVSADFWLNLQMSRNLVNDQNLLLHL